MLLDGELGDVKPVERMLLGDGKDVIITGGTPGKEGLPGCRGLSRQDTVVGGGCVACGGGRLVSVAKEYPALCWHRKPTSRLTWFSAVTLLVSGIVLFLVVVTDLFNSALLQNMVLSEGSHSTQLWATPPVHPLLKVHVFNYTNVQAVLAGEEPKLKVQDVGPYTYRETTNKVNVVFNPDDTVTYQENNDYNFLPEESNGTQMDRVFFPNVPLVSAQAIADNAMMRLATSTVPMFLEKPLSQFLWGYEDTLVNLVKPGLLLMGVMDMENFGMLAVKNGTMRDKLTIHTGKSDLNKIGIMKEINGQEKLHCWASDDCNRLDGSIGSLFPPSMLDRKQTLYIFKYEMCRRLPLTFEKEVEVMHGMKALRYSVPLDVFDSPDKNSANQCFCNIETGVCPPKGVFDASPCVMGSPIFPSFPHLYNADPALQEAVEGLEPLASRHAIFLDIHPTLGIVLRAVSRIQLNIRVKKPSNKHLQDGILLPIIWMETSVMELPQELQTLLYHGTFSANLARHLITGISLIIVLASAGVLLVACRTRRVRKIPRDDYTHVWAVSDK